jgi:predicted nucleotidyltransferase
MTRTIDLSPAELDVVRGILRAHLPPHTRAWVFGSRATATARQYSDLDIALEAATPLGFDVLGTLTEALSESDLPYKVDLVDLKSVEPPFRTLIEADMIALAF